MATIIAISSSASASLFDEAKCVLCVSHLKNSSIYDWIEVRVYAFAGPGSPLLKLCGVEQRIFVWFSLPSIKHRIQSIRMPIRKINQKQILSQMLSMRIGLSSTLLSISSFQFSIFNWFGCFRMLWMFCLFINCARFVCFILFHFDSFYFIWFES